MINLVCCIWNTYAICRFRMMRDAAAMAMDCKRFHWWMPAVLGFRHWQQFGKP